MKRDRRSLLCSETEPVIEDVRKFFPEAVEAEKKELNLLVLWKLEDPEKRLDGKIAHYALIHRWLSENDVHCVKGSERTLLLKKEVDIKKGLFEQFNLFKNPSGIQSSDQDHPNVVERKISLRFHIHLS